MGGTAISRLSVRYELILIVGNAGVLDMRKKNWLVSQLCVRQLDQYCFRLWLATCLKIG